MLFLVIEVFQFYFWLQKSSKFIFGYSFSAEEFDSK